VKNKRKIEIRSLKVEENPKPENSGERLLGIRFSDFGLRGF